MEVETIYANRVFDFLKDVAPVLRTKHHKQQAEQVEYAMKYYIFPLTSEFYGVAMMALRDVIDNAPGALPVQQLERARYFADAIKAQWYSR